MAGDRSRREYKYDPGKITRIRGWGHKIRQLKNLWRELVIRENHLPLFHSQSWYKFAIQLLAGVYITRHHCLFVINASQFILIVLRTYNGKSIAHSINRYLYTHTRSSRRNLLTRVTQLIRTSASYSIEFPGSDRNTGYTSKLPLLFILHESVWRRGQHDTRLWKWNCFDSFFQFLCCESERERDLWGYQPMNSDFDSMCYLSSTKFLSVSMPWVVYAMIKNITGTNCIIIKISCQKSVSIRKSWESFRNRTMDVKYSCYPRLRR